MDQLEPGDLIFYSGAYIDPSRKKQIFNMTHVEIFIGGSTGEATLGEQRRGLTAAPVPAVNVSIRILREG